jgi:anti-sigma regulatory factor (Ser/Thr protein kinase)
MTDAALRPLSFLALDGLAFAASRGRLEACRASKTFTAGELGPTMELFQLDTDGLLSLREMTSAISLGRMTEMHEAIRTNRTDWLSNDSRLGFFRTTAEPPINEEPWTEFRVAAQEAAKDAGFPRAIARQFVGALGELRSNIYEHSEASQTGIVAFRATPGLFEFVVADRGIGILKSLTSCSEHAQLTDHGDALQHALKDGCSRHGSGMAHGNGFRPIFVGLGNLNGSLRFRSGDHALTIDGRDPKHMPWKKSRKPPISGFFASISCILNGNGVNGSAHEVPATAHTS